MSKHGGSPESGIAEPIGMGDLVPIQGSAAGLLAPPIAKQNLDAKERARQFERRRIALECIPALITARAVVGSYPEQESVSTVGLQIADELMAQTGGFVTGAARE